MHEKKIIKNQRKLGIKLTKMRKNVKNLLKIVKNYRKLIKNHEKKSLKINENLASS